MKDGVLVPREHSELWFTSRQRYLTSVSVPRKAFLGLFQVPSRCLHFVYASTTSFLNKYAEVLPVECGSSSAALVYPHRQSQETCLLPSAASN